MNNYSKPLFHGDIVASNRIIYTPSSFAKSSLFHIQEIGKLEAHKPHISKRENLNSFLFFTVLSGSGLLYYDHTSYSINSGDCVFIDCNKPYYHSTSDNLWTISWVHFNGPTAKEIYNKYIERGGSSVFTPISSSIYVDILEHTYELACSSDHVRDMKINTSISMLLSSLMEDSWNPDIKVTNEKDSMLIQIKKYIDENYAKKITLDELSERYFINKYYLTRIFKIRYGLSINTYIINIRITMAKKELRFTDKSIEQIGLDNGFGALYYFSRVCS